jgi:hypothetical protein
MSIIRFTGPFFSPSIGALEELGSTRIAYVLVVVTFLAFLLYPLQKSLF